MDDDRHFSETKSVLLGEGFTPEEAEAATMELWRAWDEFKNKKVMEEISKERAEGVYKLMRIAFCAGYSLAKSKGDSG